MEKYLGIDIGGTFIKYGIFSKDGIELSSGKVKTTMITLDRFINTLVNIINENEDVDGIGVSMPGFIDTNTGYIIDAGSIYPLHNRNLKEIIYEKCGRDIEIENDANCVALAEKWMGNGKEYSDFLVMTIGTGIGGGIIIDNKLYKGNRFMAGEFGYMIVDGVGNKTSKYTSSKNASTKALIDSVARVKFMPREMLNGKKIFEMIENNDEKVIDIYNKWINNLALNIYNLVYIFNPEAILIGGGVSRQSRLIDDIKMRLYEIDKRTIEFVNIETCKFCNNSGKIGAVYNYLFKNNKIDDILLKNSIG